MRYIFLALLFTFKFALAQQKERTISVTCYVNAELYMEAGVIAYVSDKAGNISCQGHYVNISNKSKNLFYYLNGNRWIALKPQARAVSYMGGSLKSASVVNLKVKYSPDASGGITTKIKTIDLLNAQSDRAKTRELEGDQSVAVISRPTAPVTKLESNPTVVPQKSSPTKAETKPQREPTVAKTQTKTSSPAARKVPVEKKQATTRTESKTSRHTGTSNTYASKRKVSPYSRMSARNALGLRVDFGTGATGIGPNYKRYFSKNVALDASLIFFEGNLTSLVGQVEKHFIMPSDPGLSLYVGAGPQLLFSRSNTALALVPVGGIEYNIPATPINLSFDWRPSLFLSPDADAEAGRFGLSLRIRF